MCFRNQGFKATAVLVAVTGFFACRATNNSDVKDTEVRNFEGELGMKPGSGYETIFEDVRGNCVDFDGFDEGNTSQEAIYDLKLIENTRELGIELNVSSAAQVKAAIPDTPASVSAKTKFALGHSYTLNRYSIFILAKVQVRNDTTQLKNPRIKDTIKADLANAANDPDAVDRFRLKCGDSYMSGYTTGGEFFGVLELATDSEEAKAELKQSVEAAISAATIGEASTEQSFELKLKNATKNKNLKIWTYQRGGQGAEQVGLVDSPEAMIARIKAFPEYVKAGANPSKYTATYQDYFTLDVPLPTTYRDALFSAQDNLDELAALQAELIDRRGDIDYVLAHPNSFEVLTSAKTGELSKAKTANDVLMRKIFNNARDCYRKFRDCKVADDVHPTALELPKRKSTIAAITNDYVLIKTKLEHVDVDNLYDGPFNPPECYLEVVVKAPNGKFKRLRRTPTGYDTLRCHNLDHSMEVPLVLLREAIKSLGTTEDKAIIEVRAMEDDPGINAEDVVGKLSRSFKDLMAQSAIADTLTGDNITMRVDFEVH